MSILSDKEIRDLCETEDGMKRRNPMINPFVGHQQRIKTIPFLGDKNEEVKIISFGLSSYGYDLRLGRKFKVFTNINSTIIDPKNFDPNSFVEKEGDQCVIPPNSFLLAYSMERIALPRDVTGLVIGKSTYARTGINCICTPLEAGWEGHVTLEFSNTTNLPAIMYAEEGACQVVFFKGSVPCEVSYADRNGKYMDQAAEPILPKV